VQKTLLALTLLLLQDAGSSLWFHETLKRAFLLQESGKSKVLPHSKTFHLFLVYRMARPHPDRTLTDSLQHHRPSSSLGYRPLALEAQQPEMKTGHGEVDRKLHFPLPHTHDEILTTLD
jgi:hypothetical protein